MHTHKALASRKLARLALPALLLGVAAAAVALKPTSVSPQGEVSHARQVRVSFDRDAVTAGDPTAPAPYTIACTNAASKALIPKYSSAWRNARTWALDFEGELPAETRCTLKPVAGFKSPAGDALVAQSVQFQTGAPRLITLDVQGGNYGIDENQIFIARFSSDVDAASVQAASRCDITGLGERVPMRLIEGQPREAVLASRWYRDEAKAEPNRFVLLQCNRSLPPDADLTVRVGTYRGAGGSVNDTPYDEQFRARSPLEASFSCERPSVEEPCLPIRPMKLSFNAPVPMQWAKQVALKAAGGASIAPTFEDDDAQAEAVRELRFAGALPESAAFQLIVPQGLVDETGRALSNADTFPLSVHTGPMPALAKFAAAPFGVVERFAEGKDGPALLPVTLRKVETDLASRDFMPAGTVRSTSPQSDAEIIRWFQRVRFYHENSEVDRADALADGVRDLPPKLPKARKGSPEEGLYQTPDERVQTRMIALLDAEAQAKSVALPKPENKDQRPFEIVGIPLEPGFHVLEIASPMLGQYLLDPRFGNQRTTYVRTTALVTNLGVHFKKGRENALVWVTQLDTGAPVPNAAVAVSDCKGNLLANGLTNEQGIWQSDQALRSTRRCSYMQDEGSSYDSPLFVSARASQAKGDVVDMAFTWSDWDRGIESWRFHAPTDTDAKPDVVAHTVMDRTLLRAGQTVSMKHFVRTQTLQGLGEASVLPVAARITHVGTDKEVTLPLTWRSTSTRGKVAESQWEIPKEATLGVYDVRLVGANDEDRSYDSGSFRVEEFRLPVMSGSIAPSEKGPLVALAQLPLQVQLAYINGGAASGLKVEVSASSQRDWVSFDGYDEYTFGKGQRWESNDDEGEQQEQASPGARRLLLDKFALTLDKSGVGTLKVENIPQGSNDPLRLSYEASYSDPNGEIQTIQGTGRIWPAGVVAGLRTEGWVSVGRDLKVQALALDTKGVARAGTKLSVRAILHTTTSSRKRLVGGFYSYDNQKSSKDLGEVCSGKSDSRGLLLCNVSLSEAGEVEMLVSATDDQGRTSQASDSVYVTRQGEIWWGGEDHDRMDVLPAKHSYEGGETAQLQVRMPFRSATALLTVEREGILHSEVLQLSGQDPTVSLKVRPEWGPNVYVSVLAVRGRLYEVPWYSFFTWGFKSPLQWWRAFWYDSKQYAAPGTLVDLSKPAFRLGMAPINVGLQAHTLNVQVKSDKERYETREQAHITITAQLPDGKPAANAEVALAAVDEALLELKPNTTWDLLHAMFGKRSWGVETSTAQMEIIGRRHYGRKAVPAGGGGGASDPTRELFDTLLLWNPRVQLDANGQAQVDVPLNDSLTRFRIVAVADSGQDLFGTGQTHVRTSKDLQIISGLPPLVRQGDRFRAQITLRNATESEMDVEVTGKASSIDIAPQRISIPPESAREVFWDVAAPAQAMGAGQEIAWEISARDQKGKASDAIKLSQRIAESVPLAVMQAALKQVDGTLEMNWAAPEGSQSVAGGSAARGGIKVSLVPTLAEGLPAVRDWFNKYPYECLEQKTSKYIGLRDLTSWQQLMGELPNYLDANGLAMYFPPQNGANNEGSDTLSAYLLALSHEASALDAAWKLPAAQRDAMLAGLTRYVEGKIRRDFWSPRADRDVRKITAIEALSRYGKAQPRMWESVRIAPNEWPTHAVIDWYLINKRLKSAPGSEARKDEAAGILRARLGYQGTKLIFNTESDDYWWWLMVNGDLNSARLILAVLDDPAWRDDLPALMSGLIARQQNGAWHTTTANIWGGLALEQFAAKFEKDPVAGQTRIALGKASDVVDWAQVKRLDASAQPHKYSFYGAPSAPGMYVGNSVMLAWQNAPGKPQRLVLTQQGSGKPWATVQSIAALPLNAPLNAGYTLRKTITPLQEAVPGQTTRGDIWRVRLDINANSAMTWVVLSDPVPGGATILGSGLGRDSAIATQDEETSGRGARARFVERSFEAYRAYYEYLPQGESRIEYTVRLNNVGEFKLPPTRIEALYAPEIFGAAPNQTVKVQAAAKP